MFVINADLSVVKVELFVVNTLFVITKYFSAINSDLPIENIVLSAINAAMTAVREDLSIVTAD